MKLFIEQVNTKYSRLLNNIVYLAPNQYVLIIEIQKNAVQYKITDVSLLREFNYDKKNCQLSIETF